MDDQTAVIESEEDDEIVTFDTLMQNPDPDTLWEVVTCETEDGGQEDVLERTRYGFFLRAHRKPDADDTIEWSILGLVERKGDGSEVGAAEVRVQLAGGWVGVLAPFDHPKRRYAMDCAVTAAMDLADTAAAFLAAAEQLYRG